MQGKKRQKRGSRKGIDWNDVMDTVLRTDLPEKDIIAMSRAERAAARERAKPEQARKAAERAERVRLWRAWSDDPDRFGVLDWKKYLESIGRLDLWRDLSAPEAEESHSQ